MSAVFHRGVAMSFRQKAYLAFIVLGFVLALAVRISFTDDLWGMDLSCGNYDGMEYHWLAKNLCRGRGLCTFSDGGFLYRLLRPPGYPLYIAAVYCLAGMSFFSLRMADTLLSAASAVMAALIARALAGRKAALIALALAVFYRPAAFFAARIFSENLFCFLMLLAILVLVLRGKAPWGCAGAGVLSGLLILTRPVWLGVVPFMLAWIAASRGRRCVRASSFLAGIALALAPWAIYCRAALDMPVTPATFSSLRGVYSTWLAHNPAAGDFTQLGPEPGRDLEHEWALLMHLRFKHRHLPEAEYTAAVGAEAKRFMRENPRRCIALGIRRVYRAWLGSGMLDGQGTILPDTGRNPYGVIRWKKRMLDPSVYLGDEEIIEQLPFRRELRLLGVHLPLLSFEGVFYLAALSLPACALLRALHPARRPNVRLRGYALLPTIAIGYAFTNIFSVTIQRFRFPLEYLVIVAAGTGIACALTPPLRFLGALLRTFAPPRAAGDSGPLRPSRSPLPRAAWGFTVAVVALGAAALCACHIRSFRAELAAQCAVRVTDADVLSRMGRGSAEARGAPPYRAVLKRQAEGSGDLGEMLGRTVLWRGEATWINPPSRADFHGEYHLRRAQERFTPGMRNPGFFRLIVDSYRDPASIGSGVANVVAPAAVIERLREGDHVAVLGRLGGADFVEGSMIVCADGVLNVNPG